MTNHLERRLRRDAARLKSAAPPSLAAGAIARVRRAGIQGAPRPRGILRRFAPLAAAAAVLASVLLWGLSGPGPEPAPGRSRVAANLRELVDLGETPLLAYANAPLRAETEAVIGVASRTARAFLDGLPGALRRRLELP